MLFAETSSWAKYFIRKLVVAGFLRWPRSIRTGRRCAGGTPVTLVAHLNADQLDTNAGTTAGTTAGTPTGVAMTESGDTIGMAARFRLADGCELITTVHAANGAVLCLGRTRRTATRSQRRALAARDLGC